MTKYQQVYILINASCNTCNNQVTPDKMFLCKTKDELFLFAETTHNEAMKANGLICGLPIIIAVFQSALVSNEVLAKLERESAIQTKGLIM